MCGVFHFSICNWLHGQVAAELQAWDVIVSFNEVAESGLEAVARKRASECFQFFISSSTYKMQQQVCSNRNRVHFLCCRCEGVERVTCLLTVVQWATRMWEAFGISGIGCCLWCFQHSFVCLKCEKEVSNWDQKLLRTQEIPSWGVRHLSVLAHWYARLNVIGLQAVTNELSSEAIDDFMGRASESTTLIVIACRPITFRRVYWADTPKCQPPRAGISWFAAAPRSLSPSFCAFRLLKAQNTTNRNQGQISAKSDAISTHRRSLH